MFRMRVPAGRWLTLRRLHSWCDTQRYFIRPANELDIPLIQDINVKSLPENYSEEFYRHHIRSFPSICLVAETHIKEDIAGYLICSLEEDNAPIPRITAHVTSIAVATEHRRRGIAARLMNTLHYELSKSPRVGSVYLHCRMSNTASIKMYRQLGYRCAQRIRGYYPDGEDAWQLDMTLRQHSYYAARSPTSADEREPTGGNAVVAMY